MRESQIITVIANYLQYQENLNKLLFIRNNSGALPTRTGGFIKFGKRGSSDFIVFIKNGEVLHIECKTEKGRQTTSQLEYEIKLKQLGHKYYIVRGVDEVEFIIKKYEKRI